MLSHVRGQAYLRYLVQVDVAVVVLVQDFHDAPGLGLTAQTLQRLQSLLQLSGGDDVSPGNTTGVLADLQLVVGIVCPESV